MTAAEQRPRPDLSALRIEREPEREQRTIPVVRIFGWAIFIIALVAGAVARGGIQL